MGSYYCSCPVGYRLQSDGLTCLGKNNFDISNCFVNAYDEHVQVTLYNQVQTHSMAVSVPNTRNGSHCIKHILQLSHENYSLLITWRVNNDEYRCHELLPQTPQWSCIQTPTNVMSRQTTVPMYVRIHQDCSNVAVTVVMNSVRMDSLVPVRYNILENIIWT